MYTFSNNSQNSIIPLSRTCEDHKHFYAAALDSIVLCLCVPLPAVLLWKSSAKGENLHSWELLPSMGSLTIASHISSCYPLGKCLYLISLVSHLVLSIRQWERNKLTVAINWYLLSLRKASCVIWSNCFWDLTSPTFKLLHYKWNSWEVCVCVCPWVFLLSTWDEEAVIWVRGSQPYPMDPWSS